MVSSKYARQQERERKIFQKFADIYPHIVKSSIESRPEPEPDIRCEIIGEGLVAFEMTSLEAEQFRKDRDRQFKNLYRGKDFRGAIAKYPELIKRYRGAGFFLDDMTLSIEQVCQLLAEAPYNREKLFLLENGIVLYRSDRNHPPRLLAGCIKADYSIISHIEKKLNKVACGKLRSSEPIEMLAHFDMPLSPTSDDWELISEDLRNSLTGKLNKVGMRRVWVFDPYSEAIRFVYPPP